jgi:glycosyltransferase involved in cell wall biosynthesis
MGKKERPLLSISLLASNRPDTIRRCLDSLKPVMEQIPSELILVDTSGSEEIHSILLEYTDKVVTFSWCNDFAKARNAGLREATGEWFLFLDDDEWFTEPEPLVNFFRSGEYREYGCANYLVRNYYDVEYTQYMDCWVSRMIRRYDDTHFESKIHEYVVPVIGECQNVPARVDHSGYVYRTPEEKEAHFKRNASLLREMVASEPERMRWKVQLVQEYRASGRLEELDELCQKYLKECASVSGEADLMDYGTFYAASADGRNRLGRYEDAIRMAEAGLSDERMNETCRGILYLYEAVAYEHLMEWEKAQNAVLHYMTLFDEIKENPRRRERQKWALVVEEAFEPQKLKVARDILEKCEKKQTCVLTISMLVSGREETTERSLQSLAPILNELNSELILVDTGCSPKLRKKLEYYTREILTFSWCNDFAKARNAGLEKASGEWFMFLDDDEWFEDVEPIVDFFRSGLYREYDQAVYKVRNYTRLDGLEYRDEWVSRLIKREPDTRFEGRVHEALVPARGKCRRIDAFVHHFGYAYASEEEKQAHQKRNTTLLEQLMKEEPDNMRWPLHLLKEYITGSRWEDLRAISFASLKVLEGCDQPFLNQCRGSFYSAILLAERELHEYDALHAHFAEYMQDSRLNETSKCSLCMYDIKGLYDCAEEQGCWALLAERCADYLKYWNIQNNMELSEQEKTIQESIVLVNYAIRKQDPIWVRNVRLLAMHHAGGMDAQLQEEVSAAQDELCGEMEGNGEFLYFEESYWKLGAEGILPLEDIILSLSVPQWMAQVYSLKGLGNMKLWEILRGYLEDLRTREDVRYSYFFMNFYNESAAQIGAVTDFAQAEKFLGSLCEWNLNYAREVYTEAAFQGEMEMLPESCRAAVYLERAMSCSMDEWNQKLDNLRLAAKAWAKLANLLKQYAQLLGAEKERQNERQNEEAKRAQEQLQQMAKSVLQQVSVMIRNGMQAEALETVRQLREMLPEDRELAELEEKLKADVK